jgi:hypothetical protein
MGSISCGWGFVRSKASALRRCEPSRDIKGTMPCLPSPSHHHFYGLEFQPSPHGDCLWLGFPHVLRKLQDAMSFLLLNIQSQICIIVQFWDFEPRCYMEIYGVVFGWMICFNCPLIWWNRLFVCLMVLDSPWDDEPIGSSTRPWRILVINGLKMG